MNEGTGLVAGAAVVDITPQSSVFLFGYPNVPRWSTGTHDPLLASALYLSDGSTGTLFIANDIIFITLSSAKRIRQRISAQTQMQSTSVTDVTRGMQGILRITEETTEGTKQTNVSIGQLTKLAAELRSSVAGFKV